MKSKSAVLMVMMLFGLITLAFAQPRPLGGPDWKPGPGQQRMMAQLNLTDEQIAQIADLKLELKKEMLPLRSEMAAKRNELHLLMTEDSPNQSKISKAIKAMGDIRTKIQEKMVQHRLKVRSLLDENQKKKFDLRTLNGRRGKMGRGGQCCDDMGPKHRGLKKGMHKRF